MIQKIKKLVLKSNLMTLFNTRTLFAGGIVFIFCCYWLLYSTDLTWMWQINSQLTRVKDPNFNNANLKTILLWNTYFSMKHFGLGTGRKPFVDAKCPITNCTIIDREDGLLPIPVEDFDAVLFHMADSSLYLPLKRKPHQHYIFFVLESPVNLQKMYQNENIPLKYFNWTMTYLRKSDIYYPYGWIDVITENSDNLLAPHQKSPKWKEPDYSNIINNTEVDQIVKKKRKLVAWFVSNCNSQSERLKYVEELSKYISVDVFGICGPLKCSRATSNECDNMLDNDYKFYLSFENSLCEDYVTEKFFRAMRRNVVPIVYGGSNYKIVAPPMSYINVADFKSQEDLADYLKHLDKHPEEYKKYFWWKSWYRVLDRHTYILCLLCQMLNNSTLPNKVYDDIKTWWNEDKCHSPEEHFFQQS